MDTHVHITWVHLFAGILATIIIFGTAHMVCTLNDNRIARAWIALGF